MNPAKLLASLAAGCALVTFAWAADTTVKLSGVHLCCNACVKGVEKAVSPVKGATTVVDKDSSIVVVRATDRATAQQVIDALVDAGYYGASSDPTLKPKDRSVGVQGKVQKLTVAGVHLCCGKCVKAVNDAVTKVKGVKGTTAEKNAAAFDVTGDFQARDVLVALQKAGLSGQAKQ